MRQIECAYRKARLSAAQKIYFVLTISFVLTKNPHPVTLSSSSHAYAVSILPKGKMLDLQGGSSSFPKISLRCDFREPC